ncbi:MAG: GNAT family N-acetyltransferase [Gemmataceae bacterium]
MILQLPDQLDTARLRLRPLEERDYPAYAAFMCDEIATRYLLFSAEQRSDSGARALFEQVLSSYASAEPIFVLAIALKEQDRYIGSCGLSPGSCAGEVECFYTLLRASWGHGYATEAMRKLARYACAELGVERLLANVSVENPASARVARRLSMQLEETFTRDEAGALGERYVLTRSQALLSSGDGSLS